MRIRKKSFEVVDIAGARFLILVSENVPKTELHIIPYKEEGESHEDWLSRWVTIVNIGDGNG